MKPLRKYWLSIKKCMGSLASIAEVSENIFLFGFISPFVSFGIVFTNNISLLLLGNCNPLDAVRNQTADRKCLLSYSKKDQKFIKIIRQGHF